MKKSNLNSVDLSPLLRRRHERTSILICETPTKQLDKNQYINKNFFAYKSISQGKSASNTHIKDGNDQDRSSSIKKSLIMNKYKILQKKNEFQAQNRSLINIKSDQYTDSFLIRRKSEEDLTIYFNPSQKIKRLSLLSSKTIVQQHIHQKQTLEKIIFQDKLEKKIASKIMKMKNSEYSPRKTALPQNFNFIKHSSQRQRSIISKNKLNEKVDIVPMLSTGKIKFNLTPTNTLTNLGVHNLKPLDDKLNSKIANLKVVNRKRKRSLETLKNIFKKKTGLILITAFMQKLSTTDNIKSEIIEPPTPVVQNKYSFQQMIYQNEQNQQQGLNTSKDLRLIFSEHTQSENSSCFPQKECQELNFINVNRKLPQLQKILKFNKSLSLYAFKKNPQEIVTLPNKTNIGINQQLKKSIRLQLKTLTETNHNYQSPNQESVKTQPQIYSQQKNQMQNFIAQIRKKQTSCHSQANMRSTTFSQSYTKKTTTGFSLSKIRLRRTPQ